MMQYSPEPITGDCENEYVCILGDTGSLMQQERKQCTARKIKKTQEILRKRYICLLFCFIHQ